jgi:tripartite-type tricarboxylate transporter receptor subunit TctC
MIACTRALRRLVCIAVCAFTFTAWGQQPFPAKPVRLIIPTAPGGSTDMLARLIGLKLTDRWGQQVIADNRAGGNGVIAGEALAKAAADGYTIMITSSAHIITPLITRTPYDAIDDFAPVAANATSENILVIHPSLPAKDLQQFIRIAKASPGQLNYATGGVGTLAHLAAFCSER